MTKLHLVRHARSVDNAIGRIQGVTDSPLDDVGRAQAEALSKSLSALHFDRLLSSPQSRALETAHAIQAHHPNALLRVDERLRERDAGRFTGLNSAQMRTHTGLPTTDLHALEWQAPDGETADRLRVRVQSLLDDLRTLTAERVCVVTHGTVLNALLLAALGVPATSSQVFRFDNASVTELDFFDGRWSLHSLNKLAEEQPITLDFAESWRLLAANNNGARQDNKAEIAFWAARAEDYARQYDNEFCQQTHVVKSVLACIQPGDRVLDIGAGVGRFALPIALRPASVTALDLSPDMLAVLAHRCARAHVDASHIQLVQGDFEVLDLQAHDVVLAAWSLYRLRDPLHAMRKLVAATKRILIIIDSDHADSKSDTHIGVCNYLYLAGILRQVGACASVQVLDSAQAGSAVGLVTWQRPPDVMEKR